jgi:chromosome segregation ATPase
MSLISVEEEIPPTDSPMFSTPDIQQIQGVNVSEVRLISFLRFARLITFQKETNIPDAVTDVSHNQKLEEVARLEAELEQKDVAVQRLSDEVDRVKVALASVVATADDLGQKLGESQALLTNLREQHATEASAWGLERETLVDSVDQLTRSKSSLENDVTFLQTQYHNVSRYTTTLQEEGKELTRKAEIAESQVKEGLPMIKGFFEERIQKLEEEVRKWKGLCALLQEKDARTGDDIRRRAGEEAELRVQVEELEAEVDRRAEIIDDLEVKMQVLEGSERMWRHLAEEKRNGDASQQAAGGGLRKTKAGQKVEQHRRMDDLVYLCQWRIGSMSVSCGDVFENVQVCLVLSKPTYFLFMLFRHWRSTYLLSTCVLGDNVGLNIVGVLYIQ